jgi:hypothetical protein
MRNRHWRITTEPDDLEEGLFGQVLLWTFEILPYLDQANLQPEWFIRSRLYGQPPDYCVIPGVLDIAYEPVRHGAQEKSLLSIRLKNTQELGDDWGELHKLWSRYFKIPRRILERADAIGLPTSTLGVHFRGTDKQRAIRETNPVEPADMIVLIKDFVARHPEVSVLFLATDEYSFVEMARQSFPEVPVVNLGEVAFHKSTANQPDKAERAMLDSVLLSRCGYVLKCSSALSGFAKILNPKLKCYRVAASKMFGEIPYYPDAYIPRLQTPDPRCQLILARQFAGDWAENHEGSARPQTPFVSRRRYSTARYAVNAFKYLVYKAFGATRKA